MVEQDLHSNTNFSFQVTANPTTDKLLFESHESHTGVTPIASATYKFAASFQRPQAALKG